MHIRNLSVEVLFMPVRVSYKVMQLPQPILLLYAWGKSRCIVHTLKPYNSSLVNPDSFAYLTFSTKKLKNWISEVHHVLSTPRGILGWWSWALLKVLHIENIMWKITRLTKRQDEKKNEDIALSSFGLEMTHSGHW